MIRSSITIRALLAITLAFMLSFGRQAMAQSTPQCGPLGDVMARLFDGFGESLVASFTIKGGDRFMVLANPETGSWTMLLRREPDLVCAAAFGTDWITALQPPPGDPT
jgi:hypothetical protein